uniref:Phosphate-selective porin O and P n=1 Tax=Magnetococcus massalia (strain MO-1) TaxID=451514 RepID=A0A1S7LLM1_MAGMO|nr:conserved exported protein of unknown function [Candidatus Magnetococcus massalia]
MWHFRPLLLASSLLPLLAAATAQGAAYGDEIRTEWSGYLAGELRLFPESPLGSRQEQLYPSLSGQLEYFREWAGGEKQLRFTPFVRLDAQDSERTHLDIRELVYDHLAEDWELSIGLRKLFWGVTESRHLVDVINQTDSVEGTDGEDKLGQPMVSFSLLRDWGQLSLFWMPYFRERTFPGLDGRPGYTLRIADEHATFESAARETHQDLAIRYSHTWDIWDFALSHFSGTARSPVLSQQTIHGESLLVPHYYQLEQTALELQATTDAWLWKLEAVSRDDLQGRSMAAVGGFEYTFVGIQESDADLGLISEYLWEEQGESALSPFANDLMVGARMTLNDAQSTEFLAGGIVDLDDQALYLTLEASRRIGDSWKLSIDGWSAVNMEADDPLYGRRRDTMLQLELARYF